MPAAAPAMHNPRQPAMPLYAVLAVLAFSALWVLLGSMVVSSARLHDFLNLYTGASLARDGNFAGMHLPDVQLQRERQYAPELPELVPFVRPAFYGLLLAPLAWAPFGSAFWAWLCIQAGLLAGTWVWAYRRWGTDALIFGSMFLPTALGIAHGQDCVLILLIVLGTYTLAERRLDFLSGAVLGAGLIKFHLFLLWPVMLLIQKRWKTLAGFCAAATLEVSISLLLQGAEGLARYAALLRMTDLRHLSPSPELMINAGSISANLFANNALATGVLTALAVCLTIAACWRAPLWRAASAASAGSLLAAPHVYGYDAGLLLAGLWLVLFESKARAPRMLAAVLMTPVPMLLALAGSPWSAVTPLVLFAFLASLAWMTHYLRPERIA